MTSFDKENKENHKRYKFFSNLRDLKFNLNKKVLVKFLRYILEKLKLYIYMDIFFEKDLTEFK